MRDLDERILEALERLETYLTPAGHGYDVFATVVNRVLRPGQSTANLFSTWEGCTGYFRLAHLLSTSPNTEIAVRLKGKEAQSNVIDFKVTIQAAFEEAWFAPDANGFFRCSRYDQPGQVFTLIVGGAPPGWEFSGSPFNVTIANLDTVPITVSAEGYAYVDSATLPG